VSGPRYGEPVAVAKGARLHAPATARNRDAIGRVLAEHLPARGVVVEIASGTGEHARHFAAAFPHLLWQPSDADPTCLASIAAWGRDGPANLRPPLALDVARWPWPVDRAEALVCVNLLHIAPWVACQGLMRGAGRVLAPGGVLVVYGPFMKAGRHTAESNARFDRSLRASDPGWGVRDLAAVTAEAAANGLTLTAEVAMPANNLSLVFAKP